MIWKIGGEYRHKVSRFVDELYEIESYDNRIESLGKVYAYQLYFNYLRKNRYRENKSPVEILREIHKDR